MSLRGWLARPAAAETIWRGTAGVRAGWRAAMFLALAVALIIGLVLLAAHTPLLIRPTPGMPLSPGFVFMNETLFLLAVALAAWLMAWLEGRALSEFGLRGGWRLRRLAVGLAVGITALAGLAGVLLASFHATLAGGGLGAGAALAYGAVWLGLSLLTGFTEEFAFRGYLLVALARGMGFWPAALLTSLVFGALHFTNAGEGLLGLLSVACAGMLFCLAIRRTGSLWWSIGFHGGWDYAENFIFGTHDSGNACAGALLQLWPRGAAWLSGGATGPEGSVFCLGVLGLAAFGSWAGFSRNGANAR
jgi:membrane protease YdiL (CAAX protease family)